MASPTLFSRFFPPLLGLLVVTTGVMVIPLTEHANRILREESRASLRQMGDLLREVAVDPIIDRHPQTLSGLCRRLGSPDGLSVVIAGADGAVLCSSGDIGLGAKGIEPALAGAPVWREGERMAVALPIISEGVVIGAVALSRPAPAGGQGGFLFWVGMLLLVTGAAAFVAWRMRRVVNGPLELLGQGAARYALARFDQPVYGGEIAEFATVAESLNRMGGALAGRLTEADESDRGGVAILASMKEGVLAVGPDGAIIRVNPALRRILSIRSEVVAGAPLADVLPNGDLLRTLTEALAHPTSLEREVVYEHGPTPRSLQLVATPLILDKGVFGGLVATISDVTDLRRLENLRRDFAANVSHELRTPITSIRGYVETLREDDLTDPEQTRRFLDVVQRHVDRLGAIVEDLLTLARLDRRGEKEGEETPFVEQPLLPILTQAVEDLTPKAAGRKVAVTVDCPPGVAVRINRPLVERAVTNLLDNAIAHSDEGKTVEVTATVTGKTLYLAVRDRGVGIDKAHLERIFERFYRVDAARSRARGGTGLGLSIVKNVALAHGGRVTVQSVPGEGSVFTLIIPA
ncbi:MAG: PAS domain-containing protein [Nitrospinae bacterium]|nr:PAS domain-containing protein [Nitrospinota bacterium]